MITSEPLTTKACRKWDFQIFAVAPVLDDGWVLLGEQSKWVPVSNARFSQLSFSSDGADTHASVIAEGSFGELVSVSWLAPGASAPAVVTCLVGQGSKSQVEIGSKSMGGKCASL